MVASPEDKLKKLVRQAEELLVHYEEKGKKGAHKLQKTLHEGKDKSESYIKDHPFVSVGAAFALGYLIGRLKG